MSVGRAAGEETGTTQVEGWVDHKNQARRPPPKQHTVLIRHETSCFSTGVISAPCPKAMAELVSGPRVSTHRLSQTAHGHSSSATARSSSAPVPDCTCPAWHNLCPPCTLWKPSRAVLLCSPDLQLEGPPRHGLTVSTTLYAATAAPGTPLIQLSWGTESSEAGESLHLTMCLGLYMIRWRQLYLIHWSAEAPLAPVRLQPGRVQLLGKAAGYGGEGTSQNGRRYRARAESGSSSGRCV